ncbi:MAG: hypothetical protein M3Y82_06385 [Verrucomicrobiota bacterium]|nr:hypothetical protein [Verrucomicrobiota bacterium]
MEELKSMIDGAVDYASRKSSRAILDIPETASDEEASKIYFREGRALFNYFKKYCGDPATTAYECKGRNFKEVAAEQFHNRTLQKERMNSGWRYQRIAFKCAQASNRFSSVSDIGTVEADFNVTVETINFPPAQTVNIYVSVKNRANTVGGQDLPKAIAALEAFAQQDKNREGPYLCVFGIAMERGDRQVRKPKKGKVAYSVNTEIWLSDFFWPFFSTFSYEEMMQAVCEYFTDQGLKQENRTIGIAPPAHLIDSFGECCSKHGLVDEKGVFNDSKKLVSFFCKPFEKKPTAKQSKRKISQ